MPLPKGHRKSHCPRGHPFNSANTYIRLDGGRRCRACARERQRERRAAQRCPRCHGSGEILVRGADGRLKGTLIPCRYCQDTFCEMCTGTGSVYSDYFECDMPCPRCR